MIFSHSRFQIWNKNQHPYNHALADFFYSNPALPPATITNLQQTLDWIFAVLYPNTKTAVANVAALPASANTLNDMRVVQDDGDGKAASYRWEQREGDSSAKWYKIYDMDWGYDSILTGFLTQTQDIYVNKYGRNDLDNTGALLTGVNAGQHIYGGLAASSNLTLHANSGDGTGAQTGYIQFGDNVRPITDNTYSSGTTALRWLKVWTNALTAGTLTAVSGSITDSSGAISFDNENLSTSGSITAGTLVMAAGSITDSSGAISFDNENLITTGTFTAAKVTATTTFSVFKTGTTIGNLTLADGSITAASSAIDFSNNSLTTSGAIVGGSAKGGNLLLATNILSSTNTDGNITITPNGNGIVAITKAMTTVGQTVTGVVAITGQLNADNLRLDGNIFSSTDTNGNIGIQPDGTGWITVSSKVLPTADNSKDLGATASRFKDLFISGSIGDGTTTVAQSVIQSLRDINVGVGSGMTIFWNGSKWVASTADTEIDHGTITGLGDDDHTQYALLLGRSGGQTLYGDTASGGNLTLSSTFHATKGYLITDSVIKPSADGTLDFGASGKNWKDCYVTGQLLGARLQNATTAGRPSAAAGTKGRLIYDTDLEDVYIDRGGTWKKASLEKYVIQDSTGWAAGNVLTVTYTVSSEVSDARECIWVFKNNSDTFKQIGCDITMTQTTVTVTVEIALAAGTYTLVGVG